METSLLPDFNAPQCLIPYASAVQTDNSCSLGSQENVSFLFRRKFLHSVLQSICLFTFFAHTCILSAYQLKPTEYTRCMTDTNKIDGHEVSCKGHAKVDQGAYKN